MVAAASSRRAAFAFAWALVAGLPGTSFARDEAFDDAAVLGPPPAASVELVQTRITAYDQTGYGYQSQAGPKAGPGSETLHVLQAQGEFVLKQGEDLTHRVWVPVDLVTSASADAIDRYYAQPDVVSRASAQNVAAEVDYQLGVRAGPETNWTAAAGMHYEENFLSWLYSLEYQRSLADDNATFTLSAQQALDWFDAFHLGGARAGRTSRSTSSFNVGLSQLLSPSTLVAFAYGFTLQRGELSNTWNSVPTLTGERVSEVLPRERDRHAASVSLLQWLPWQAALELRYRFYRDDWEVTAHSFEGRLRQRLFGRLVLGASYRHHTQTGVFCFTTAVPLASSYRTADSDLGPLDADSFGGSAEVSLPTRRHGTLFLTLGYDTYFRTDDLSGQRRDMGFRLALLTACWALACGAAPGSGPVLGAPLPNVATVGVDRRPASLAEFTRGQAALVALWATWCTSCEKELAALDRLQAEVGPKALVIGVAVGEPYDKVVGYLRPRGLRYAQLIDEEFALADALGTKRVPTTLVVGKDGTLRYSGGALDRDALEAFRRALAE